MVELWISFIDGCGGEVVGEGKGEEERDESAFYLFNGIIILGYNYIKLNQTISFHIP